MTSLEKRKRELKKKKMLLLIWSIFLILVGVGITLYVTNYKKIKDAVDKKNDKKKI